jgi:hypothetical protein
MVTEYIKRGQRMGYDEKGNLVYKIPLNEEAPVTEEIQEEVEEVQQDEEVSPTFPFTIGE